MAITNADATYLFTHAVFAHLNHPQHTEGKTMIFVGILGRITHEMGRVSWQEQMEGGKAARELSGIVDQVMTLSLFSADGEGWRHDPVHAARQGSVGPARCHRAAGPRRCPQHDQHNQG